MSHFDSKKQYSLRKMFSRFYPFSVDHDPTIFGGGPIGDDWEFIEFLDHELSGSESDAESEIWDLSNDISEERLAAFMRFNSNYKIKYKILSKDDVRHRFEKKVDRICSVLALEKNEAVILLLHFNWDVDTAQEQWLSSEHDLRKAVGLFERTVSEAPDPMEGICGLCYQDDLGSDKILSVSCGHGICTYCWADHVAEAIENGSECLKLRCPGFSCHCNAAVGLEIIDRVCSEEEKKTYEEYLLRSLVTQSKKGKWCPAADCNLAVYRSSGDGSNDVTCRCFHSFCWNCMDEAHGPIDCVAAGEWKTEIFKQSGNWLLANAKPCPGCERLYEENSCDLYSTCPKCNSEIRRNRSGYCSERDSDHCKPYRSSELNDYDDDNLRKLARQSLERFRRHYEGWSNCESARKNAITDLRLLQDTRLGRLCDIWDLSKGDLEFLTEGQLQVVECWRILEWTYVYGYYLLEEPKQHLFMFLQDQATNLLRMLEKHVDNLQDILTEDISRKQYINFRSRLLQLTRVTRNYFEKMVEALNSGLSEVQVVHIPKHVSSQDNYSRPGPRQSQSSKVLRDEDSDMFSQGSYSSPGPSQSQSSKVLRDEDNYDMFSQDSYSSPTPSWRPTPKVKNAEVDDNTNLGVTRELGGLRLRKRASPEPADECGPDGPQYW